jgi:hypothetical protein
MSILRSTGEDICATGLFSGFRKPQFMSGCLSIMVGRAHPKEIKEFYHVRE